MSDEELVKVVRAGFRHTPNEHHPLCTHPAGPCDCYAKQSNQQHKALDELERRLLLYTKERTSEEICEELVRYTEMVGDDLLEKHFVAPGGKIGASVWCCVGRHADQFLAAVRELVEGPLGFKDSRPEG